MDKFWAAVCLLKLFSGGLSQSYDVFKDILPDRPHFGGVMGKYINYPGLVYEPNIPSREGLIHYTQGKMWTSEPYVSRLKSRLALYNKASQSSVNTIDCGNITGYRPSFDWNKKCRYDQVSFGGGCFRTPDFGYEDGQPCIALSLERIVNWLPEPYTNGTVPENIRDYWYEYAVTVKCEGEDPVTKDNLGDVQYFPAAGFHFKYFPLQKGWKSPIVFAFLENTTPAVVVRVTCTAYARNIKHDDILHTGKVSFDVMVD